MEIGFVTGAPFNAPAFLLLSARIEIFFCELWMEQGRRYQSFRLVEQITWCTISGSRINLITFSSKTPLDTEREEFMLIFFSKLSI